MRGEEGVELKTPGGPCHEGDAILLGVLLPVAQLENKTLLMRLGEGKDKKPFLTVPEHTVPNTFCPQERLVNSSPACWPAMGEVEHQL